MYRKVNTNFYLLVYDCLWTTNGNCHTYALTHSSWTIKQNRNSQNTSIWKPFFHKNP